MTTAALPPTIAKLPGSPTKADLTLLDQQNAIINYLNAQQQPVPPQVAITAVVCTPRTLSLSL